MHWIRVIPLAVLLALGAPFFARAEGLRVITEDLPPFNYMANGTLTGECVDIVREIMRRTGEQGEILMMPWARGYKMALEQPDVALFSTSRTLEREPLFQWVGPLTKFSSALYMRKDDAVPLLSLDDAKNLGKIGVYRDDVREQFLRTQGFDNLDVSNDEGIVLKKLLRGRVDAMASSENTLRVIAAREGIDPEQVRPVLPFMTISLHIAFSMATDEAVVTRWRQAYADMLLDGSLARIHESWQW
ncbi:MAG: substrate-binding periplasmic protein [Desulfovibrionaceae bacterium]